MNVCRVGEHNVFAGRKRKTWDVIKEMNRGAAKN